jgi:hypothetical protein
MEITAKSQIWAFLGALTNFHSFLCTYSRGYSLPLEIKNALFFIAEARHMTSITKRPFRLYS